LNVIDLYSYHISKSLTKRDNPQYSVATAQQYVLLAGI
jgi:hypothetical protein